MHRLLPLVLATTCAVAGEPAHLDMQWDATALRQLADDHPLVRTWQSGLRQTITTWAGPEATAALIAAAADAGRGRCVSSGEGPSPVWSLVAELPTGATEMAAAWSPVIPMGLTARDGTLRAGPAIAPGNEPAPFAVTWSPTAAFRMWQEVGSQRFCTAAGLTELRWTATCEPGGFADRLTLPGFRPPFAPIDPQALATLPADAVCAMAVGIDGPALERWFADHRRDPGVGSAADAWKRHAAHAGFATLAAFSGTVTASILPRPLLPALVLTTPTGGPWDVLARHLIARGGFTSVPEAPDTWRCSLPARTSPWRAFLLARHQERWVLTTETALDGLGNTAPDWSTSWTGGCLAARLAITEAARQGVTYAGLVPQGTSTTRQRVQAILAAVAQAGWADATAVGVLSDAGLSLEGSNAIAAAAPAFLTLALATGLASERIGDERRDACETSLAGAAKDPTPRFLLQPPHPCPWFDGGPWAAVCGAGADAPLDLPVAVTRPDAIAGEVSWIEGGGRRRHADLGDAGELWTVAERLVQHGRNGTAEDWAPALANLRRNLFGASPAHEGDDNWRAYPLPDRWIPGSEAEMRQNKDWDAMWRSKDDDLRLAIIAEAGDADDAELLERIDAVVLAHASRNRPARRMWSRPAATAAIAGRRLRHDLDLGGLVGTATIEHLILTHRGWAYQLMAWGPRARAAEITAGLDELAARFEPADWLRRSPAWEQQRPAGLITADTVPVDLDLRGSPWMLRPDPSAAAPHASIALAHPAAAAWAVVCAAPLPPLQQPVSDRALLAGMLALLDQPYPHADVGGERLRRIAGADGIEATFRRALAGIPLRFRVGCVRLGDRALMVAAWTAEDATAGPTLFEELVTSLRPIQREPGVRLAAGPIVWSTVAEYHMQHERWAEAWPWADAAAQASPGDANQVGRAVRALARQERWAEALAWFDDHARLATQDDLGLAAWRPWILRRLGRHVESIDGYTGLFDRGLLDHESFADLVHGLRAERRSDEAWAAFTRWPKAADTPEARRLRIRLLHDDQRDDEAVALLASWAAGGGAAVLDQADGLLVVGRPDAARQVLEELLRTQPGLARAWRLRGLAEYRMGWYHEALTSLGRARALDPADAEVVRWEEAVRRELGRGDASVLRRQLPTLLVDDPAQPAELPVPSPGGITWLLRDDRIRWTPERGLERTQRRVVHLGDAAACAAFTTIDVPFDPRRESIHLAELTVTRPGGQSEDRLHPDDAYVVDDPQAIGDGDRRMARFPATGLAPGSVLRWTLNRLEPADEPPWLHLDLSTPSPCLNHAVTILGDAERCGVAAWGGAKLVPVAGGWRSHIADPHGRRDGVYQDPTGRDLPGVALGPVRGSWPDLGRDYLKRISAALSPDPQLADEARRLCPPGTPDPAGRLLLHVASTLAYHAVEFGTRAYLPRPGGETRQRAQGDCKDHAVLLWQYLCGIGLPAHLALVGRSGVVLDALPHLDQFDHMVVVLEEDGRLRVLDATVDHLDPALVPLSLAAARLLVLDPASPHLASAPASGASGITSDRTVTLAADGTIHIQEHSVWSGYLAQHLRSVAAQARDDELPQILLTRMGEAVGAVLQAELGHRDDPSRPLELTCRWVLRASWNGSGRSSLELADPWSVWLVRCAPEPQRRRSLVCRLPLVIAATTRRDTDSPSLHLAQAVGPTDADADPRFSCFRSRAGDALTTRIEQHAGSWPSEQFAAWQQRAEHVLERSTIRCERRIP